MTLAKRRITMSKAARLRSPVESGHHTHPFIGGDKGDGSDVSGNIKAALRVRFRITHTRTTLRKAAYPRRQHT